MIFIQDITYQEIPIILDLEIKNYENPWSEKDLRECKSKNIYVKGASFGDSIHNAKIIGYIAFKITKTKIEIIRCTVHKKYRRKGIGTRLINCSIEFAKRLLRKKIQIMIQETEDAQQLDACNFLKSLGFKATGTLYNNHSLYIFQRKV